MSLVHVRVAILLVLAYSLFLNYYLLIAFGNGDVIEWLVDCVVGFLINVDVFLMKVEIYVELLLETIQGYINIIQEYITTILYLLNKIKGYCTTILLALWVGVLGAIITYGFLKFHLEHRGGVSNNNNNNNAAVVYNGGANDVKANNGNNPNNGGGAGNNNNNRYICQVIPSKSGKSFSYMMMTHTSNECSIPSIILP